MSWIHDEVKDVSDKVEVVSGKVTGVISEVLRGTDTFLRITLFLPFSTAAAAL